MNSTRIMKEPNSALSSRRIPTPELPLLTTLATTIVIPSYIPPAMTFTPPALDLGTPPSDTGTDSVMDRRS